jgi:hypothetical protein
LSRFVAGEFPSALRDLGRAADPPSLMVSQPNKSPKLSNQNAPDISGAFFLSLWTTTNDGRTRHPYLI